MRHRRRHQITDFTLRQIHKRRRRGEPAMINGTSLGATSSFQIGLVPATNFIPLQSGPTVTCDDPNVVLTPPGPDLKFTATVLATDTGASYNLTIAGTNGKGDAVTHTFNIPILPAPPQQVTDFSLDQLS
jgi:hypothetical protein